MKRDSINPIRIFGILAGVAFALFAIEGFLFRIAHVMGWRRAFSCLLMSHLFDSVAVLLLLVAFAILLKASTFRRAAILGIAGTTCFVLVCIGGWKQLLGVDQLLAGFQIFISRFVTILGLFGWFFLFLATIRLTEMCRWARICAFIGLGGRILFSTAAAGGSIDIFLKYLLPKQFYSSSLVPWIDWLNTNVSFWIYQSFSIFLFVAFFSLAIGKLRPWGECVVFAFEGRARRKEYWMWLLWWAILVNVILAIPVCLILFTKCQAVVVRGAALGLWLLGSSVLMQLLTLPVSVRRLHDRNLSGWWLVLYQVGMLIPVVNVFAGIAYFVIAGCLDGTVGPNDYGDDPKGRKAVSYAPLSVATNVAVQGTPEDRLVKIRELYEKGLLTAAEYNLKRAAIISEV